MVMGDLLREVDVVVVGGGPGGYSAAFRAAELGLETVVVDAGKRLGGACLFEGCIPSKALLHVAHVMHEVERAREIGVEFGEAKISIELLRAWKDDRVVGKLARGLAGVALQRGVEVIGGRAVFESSSLLRVEGDTPQKIVFKHAIVATGSLPAVLPGARERDRGRDGLDGCARARRDPRRAPRHRGRLCRPRAGHGVRGPGQPRDARRDDRRAPARRGPRSRPAARAAHRQALRRRPSAIEGGRGPRNGGAGRRARSRDTGPGASTASSSPWAGARRATASAWSPPASRSPRAA